MWSEIDKFEESSRSAFGFFEDCGVRYEFLTFGTHKMTKKCLGYCSCRDRHAVHTTYLRDKTYIN